MMRRFKRVGLPKRSHPVIHRLFEEMNAQQIGVLDMSDRTGIGQSTMKNWRDKYSPSVGNVEACLNVLGLTLTVKKK